MLILQVVPKEVKKARFEANDVEKMTDHKTRNGFLRGAVGGARCMQVFLHGWG